MARGSEKTIKHFTHPSHLLKELSHKSTYICNGCGITGTGTRYRCDACDFDLHEYCATCPATLTSFLHPKHQLNLFQRKPEGERQSHRVCDLCGDSIEGLFYRCRHCDFDVHPLCTQLPEHLRHVLHSDSDHSLKLQKLTSVRCLVCRDDCSDWCYGCRRCHVAIHIACVLVPCRPPTTGSRSIPPPSPYAASRQAHYQPSAAHTTSRKVTPPSPQWWPPPPPHGDGYHNYAPTPHGDGYYNYAPRPQYYGPPYYHGEPNWQVSGNNGNSAAGKIGKKFMFSLVENLTVGVLTNVLFGAVTGL